MSTVRVGGDVGPDAERERIGVAHEPEDLAGADGGSDAGQCGQAKVVRCRPVVGAGVVVVETVEPIAATELIGDGDRDRRAGLVDRR